jgi:hypothetical protein
MTASVLGSALQTAAKLAYVAGMLALVSAGTLAMLTKKLPDAKLDGVEVTATEPVLSFDSVRKETYQRDATSWFDQHWGLRGYAVRTDNSIVMSLFSEARSGQAVVARNGVLISEEDLKYVNRPDSPEAALEGAKLIARVQAKMRTRGKVLVPVIIPAKTSFFRSAIPYGWRKRGAYELPDTNVYGAFVRALGESGTVFVDGRGLLAAENRPATEVFAPTGRHWRSAAGCRVLQAALEAARPELPELGTDQIDCHARIDPDAGVEQEDFDLFRLLNVWAPKPAGMNVEVLDGKKGGPALKIPTIFVGSSFVWKFVRVSRELEVLQPSLFYYYDSSVVETTTMLITKKVEPFTDDWRKDTFGKRLFIVGILETYIPADGQKFLLELEKEIDGAGAPAP